MDTSTQGVIEIERRISARPETVFRYFVDPERYRQWQGVDAELDPRPGGLFRVTMTGRTRAVARGTYLEVDPPRRVVFTWGWEQPHASWPDGMPDGMQGVEPGTSTVEIVLRAEGEETVLSVRHSGLPDEAAYQFHSYGWLMSLNRLEVLAEGGDPGPSPFADM